MIPTRPWPENQETAYYDDIIYPLISLLKNGENTKEPIFEDTKRVLGACGVSLNNKLEYLTEDIGEEAANKRILKDELVENVLACAFRAGMEQAYRIDRENVLDNLVIWDHKLSNQTKTTDIIVLINMLKQATHSESFPEFFRTIKEYRNIYNLVKESGLFFIKHLVFCYPRIIGPYSKEEIDESPLTRIENVGNVSFLKIIPIKEIIEESEKT